jgi:hypothetical protein
MTPVGHRHTSSPEGGLINTYLVETSPRVLTVDADTSSSAATRNSPD